MKKIDFVDYTFYILILDKCWPGVEFTGNPPQLKYHQFKGGKIQVYCLRKEKIDKTLAFKNKK